MLTEERVLEELKKVNDPELKLDVVTLGLIYGVTIDNEKVLVRMTFTTPGCPYGPALMENVRDACISAGARDAEVELTFEPLWAPSEEVRWAIGAFSPWSH